MAEWEGATLTHRLGEVIVDKGVMRSERVIEIKKDTNKEEMETLAEKLESMLKVKFYRNSKAD